MFSCQRANSSGVVLLIFATELLLQQRDDPLHTRADVGDDEEDTLDLSPAQERFGVHGAIVSRPAALAKTLFRPRLYWTRRSAATSRLTRPAP